MIFYTFIYIYPKWVKANVLHNVKSQCKFINFYFGGKGESGSQTDKTTPIFYNYFISV